MYCKIDALRRVESAYRAHFQGIGAAMLWQLNDAVGDSGDASMTVGTRARLAALKRDYLSWLVYRQTHRLPEHLFSIGLDLLPLEAGWRTYWPYLAPEQQQQFSVSLAAFYEYDYLSRSLEQQAAWLAKNSGLGMHQALWELLCKGYKVATRLRMAATRTARAARFMPAQTNARRPKGIVKPKAPKAPATKRQEMEWLQYLDEAKREPAKALIPSVNAYERLQYNAEERDTWLAEDDEQGSRRAV